MDGPLWSKIGVISGPQNAGLPVLPAKGSDPGKLESWPCRGRRPEEFGGATAPEDLMAFLHQLAALATGAWQTGDRLYCWVCVS